MPNLSTIKHEFNRLINRLTWLAASFCVLLPCVLHTAARLRGGTGGQRARGR